MKNWMVLLGFLLLLTTITAQKYDTTWQSLDSRPIPKWFEEAKFGIFIHWGVYSVPAYRPLEEGLYASYAEWYYARVYKNEKSGGKAFHDKNYGEDFEYRDFAPMFKAELWDPDQWAELFMESGAKYVVLTSKHHDGFCLWPTQSPFKKNWNSKDVGPKRDIVGELTVAVRNQGLKMGLYYSIIEWESTQTSRTKSGYFIPVDHVKKYRIPEEKYVDQHLIPQLKEIVTNYQPSLIFADGGEWDGSETYWKTKEFLAWLYNESPVKDEVVVNDRFAKGMPGNHGDYYSSEYKDAQVGEHHPWEESRGIGGSYGFNRAENLDDYSSSRELILELIDIVSRGGNFLLNVGPAHDGRIPVIMQQRLRDIGEWLKINGEAIYGSQPSQFLRSVSGLKFTQNNNSVYIFVTNPEDPLINLEIIGERIVQDIELLGYNLNLQWEKDQNKISILLPEISIDKTSCIYVPVIKVSLK